MERNKSRLYRTFLVLMQLEDRMQPGTLLTTGIDAGAAAEVIAEPQQDRVIKRLKASEGIQIVSPLAQAEKLLSAPTAARRVEAAQTQQVSQNAVNPAISMPATQATGAGEKFTVGGREMMRTTVTKERAPTPTIMRVNQGAYTVQGDTTRTVSTAPVGGTTDNGGGTRGLDWTHYDTNVATALNPFGGTDRLDTAQDVAVGAAPGPCLDHTITGGRIGRIGSVRYYAPDATGTLTRQLNTSLVSGTRTEVNAIAEHPVTGEIFAAGNVTAAPINPFSVPGGTLLRNFVSKWAAPGGGCTTVGSSFPTVSTFFDTPALGGTSTSLSFNDIQIELGVASGLEVSVVGTAKDPTFAAFDVVEVVHLDDATLTVGADILLSFGSATQGLSLAVDDGLSPGPGDPAAPCLSGPAGLLGNRMIGAVIDNGGLAQPLDFTFDDSDTLVPCDWSLIWTGFDATYTPSVYPDAETGFFGMTQDGGELFSSGGMENSDPAAFQPGLDTSFVLNTDTLTGATIIAWGWLLGATGGNYTSRGNAAVPGFGGSLDDSYTTGSIDNFSLGGANTLTAIDTTHLGFDGLPVTFQSSACTAIPDEDSDGRGVAIHANGDVSAAGITNAHNDVWEQFFGPCPDGSPAQFLSADIAGTPAIAEGDRIFGGTGAQESPGPWGGMPSDGFVLRKSI